MFTIIVEVDINDGDMLKETYEVSDTLFVELKVIFEMVKDFDIQVWEDDFSQETIDSLRGVMSGRDKDLLFQHIPCVSGYAYLVGATWFVGEAIKIF